MRIEFIIATHKNVEHLKAMILCLKAQTNPNWIATIAMDGYNQEIDVYATSLLSPDDKITKHIVMDGPHGDWGHTPIQSAKGYAEEKLLCMTSDDNYYVPTFVDEMLKPFDDKRCALAYCNMVHNSYGYDLVNTEIARAKIDLGCFVTLTDFAKQIRLGKGYEDDYVFARDYANTFCSDGLYH